MTKPYKTVELIRLASRGPFRARDLDAAQIPRAYLARMRDSGVLEQIDRGLYRLVEGSASESHSLAAVIKRVPHATICLLSALQFHKLTTEAPRAVWIMIDTHARAPKLAYPPIEVVRASGAARTHGLETSTIDGVRVRRTTAAKTVADCFRYRRHVGLDVALSALREYLSAHRNGINPLVAAARADRIYPFMRPYIEALSS